MVFFFHSDGFFGSPDPHFPPLKVRGTLFTLLVCNKNHFMQRSSKLILHCSNYSESSQGLNKNNSSGRTWMFREAAGRGCASRSIPPLRGWVAAVAQSGWAAGRKESARQELHMLEHHQNPSIWVFGCWYLDILVGMHCCPSHFPNLPFPECTDGLKELTGQSQTCSSVISTLIPGAEKKMNPVV